MALQRIELHFRDSGGQPRLLTLAGEQEESAQDGVVLRARREWRESRTAVRVAVLNRGQAAVHLDSVCFHLASGFAPGTPARFFKHGYQSWSASEGLLVGLAEHRRDREPPLARIMHQSEAMRPAHLPEAATSELFTIVESDGVAERFLAGFAGAAHELTTVTVNYPDHVVARALLDGVSLRPGEEREVEALVFWRSDESAARMAAQWAGMLGEAMRARTHGRYQRGWCSWYHYFHAISEEAIRANLRTLAAMREEYPIEVVQLDDGYQSALGDWDATNAKFPGGLKKLAEEIRDAGFAAGLWTAPFLAARDSRLMREHPGWFIRDDADGPLRAMHGPSWTSSEDPSIYALDPSNPGFIAHLESLFRRLVHEFGYEYLKLDFLYAAAAEGVRHDPDLTRAETLRRGLEAIRRGAGERAFILGCGCPLGQGVGIVDGMRIGPDVAPDWGATSPEGGPPGTAQALDAVMARSFMHRRLWLNDPDCLMLRGKDTKLTRDEREALAATIAASGGMLLISDDMSLLDRESAELFRAAARIGAEVDGASCGEPPLATDLIGSAAIRILSAPVSRGRLYLVLNRGEEPATVRIADVTGAVQATVMEMAGPGGESPQSLEIAPHAARLLRIRG